MPSNRQAQQYDIRVDRFDFNVRLRSIFFPLEFNETVQILQERDFTLLKELQERLPQVPSGARLVIGGTLAEKQDIRFRINPDLGVVGIQGGNIQQVVSEYEGIEDSVKARLNVDLATEARFYELIAELSIISKSDPIATVSRLFEGDETLKKLGKELGYEVANYGVRLVPSNKPPTDEEWFEYRIEPLVSKPRTSYFSSIVFRSAAKEKVKNAALNLLEKVKTLLAIIEKQEAPK